MAGLYLWRAAEQGRRAGDGGRRRRDPGGSRRLAARGYGEYTGPGVGDDNGWERGWKESRHGAGRVDPEQGGEKLSAVADLVAEVPAGAAGLVAVALLLALLVAKELVGTLEAPWAARLERILGVAIVPLTIVFIAIVAARIVQILH